MNELSNHKDYWRALNIIWLALLVGQLIFCAVAVFMRYGGEASSDNMISYMAIGVALMCFFVSYWINQQRLQRVNKTDNEGQAQIGYRSLVIMRSALVEGGNLFALVAYLLEGNTISLLVFAAGMAYFALRTRPDEVEYRQYFLR